MKCLPANTWGGFKAALYVRLSYSSLLFTHGWTSPSPPDISTVAFQNPSCGTVSTSLRPGTLLMDTVNIHLLALILVNTVVMLPWGLSLTLLWGKAPRMPCTAVGPKLGYQPLGKESSTLIFSYTLFCLLYSPSLHPKKVLSWTSTRVNSASHFHIDFSLPNPEGIVCSLAPYRGCLYPFVLFNKL